MLSVHRLQMDRILYLLQALFAALLNFINSRIVSFSFLANGTYSGYKVRSFEVPVHEDTCP